MSHGRVLVSTWFMTEDRDTPYDGSSETANLLQEHTRIRLFMVTADVRLTRLHGLQFTATVPDITRSAVVTTGTGSFPYSENFSGLGDSSLILWGRIPTMTWNITWNAGASLPTGRTEAPRFRPDLDDGSLVPISRLQRGTGTVDPLMGVTVSRIVKRIFPPGVRVFANGAARIPIAENEHGLRTGASWEVSGGASREVKWHWLVALGRLSWLHRNQDAFNGTPVLVGGGDWLMLTPGVAVTHRALTFQAEVRVPLYRSLANRQLDGAYALQAGMVWVEVVITDQGFSPDSLEVAAGVPIELVFTRKSDKTCATEIDVPSLKFKKPLPLNEPVAVELTPAKGNIAFACGMNMLKGKLVVK